MAFYDKFPYTNFQEINLDKLIIRMLQLELEQKEFINNNVIKYADPISWNITKQYEANTVVTDEAGNAYISSQPVPAGVSINNTDYWSKIGNFDQLWTDIKTAIAPADEGSGTTATAARAVNDMVWMNNALYIVTAPMIAGDSYVVGSNCELTSVEEQLKKLIGDVDTITDDLVTTKQDLESEMEDMRTFFQQELQAIPEFPTPEAFGAIGDGITDDTAAFRALLAHCKANNIQCFIPSKSYQLTSNILFDSSLIMNNGGTYPNKKLFTNGDHVAEFNVNYLSAPISITDLRGTSYDGYVLQACTENPETGNIIIGMYSGTTNKGLLVEVTSAFSVVRRVLGEYGHINDMCYDPERRSIFIAPGGAGVNAYKLIEISASTLEIVQVYDLDYPDAPKWHVAYDDASKSLIVSSYHMQWFIDAKTMETYAVTNIEYLDENYVEEAMQNSFINDGKLYVFSFADWQYFNWYFTCYNYATESKDHIQPLQGFNNAMEFEGTYNFNGKKYMLASDGLELYQFEIYDTKLKTGYSIENMNKAGRVLEAGENVDNLRTIGVYAVYSATQAATLTGSVPFSAQRGFKLRVESYAWRATKQIAENVAGIVMSRIYNPDTHSWSAWHMETPYSITYGAVVDVPANGHLDIPITYPVPLTDAPDIYVQLYSDGETAAAYGACCAMVESATATNCLIRVFNNFQSSHLTMRMRLLLV